MSEPQSRRSDMPLLTELEGSVMGPRPINMSLLTELSRRFRGGSP
jgi:hypothetical protein